MGNIDFTPSLVKKKFPEAYAAWKIFMHEKGYDISETMFMILGDGNFNDDEEDYSGKLVASPMEEPSWWVWLSDTTDGWFEDAAIHEMV